MSHKVIEGAKMHVDTDNNHHVGYLLYYRCATEIEGRNEGLAKRLEAIFDEISVGLKSGQGIPGNLNVEEQCQFFSGYRLQRIDLNLPY